MLINRKAIGIIHVYYRTVPYEKLLIIRIFRINYISAFLYFIRLRYYTATSIMISGVKVDLSISARDLPIVQKLR